MILTERSWGTAVDLKQNTAKIRAIMEEAAGRAGRSASEIRLMAVTKNRSVEDIRTLHDEGIGLFGENRIQEAAVKYGGRALRCELHGIGHIQRNKAKAAVEIFDAVQSIDSLSTVDALLHWCGLLNKRLKLYIEFNLSGEETKYGLHRLDDAFPIIDRIMKEPLLDFEGVMTMAPYTAEMGPVRRAFAGLREYAEKISADYRLERMPVVSMGMSNDFRIAVEEGSTMVRIGSLFFESGETL